MTQEDSLIPAERIERSIHVFRGQKVILDGDLAGLYAVETRALVQAIKRNKTRFPADFMFQLSSEELEAWRSQIVISKPSARKGLRRRPYAFTEQGVAMLSSVLRSERAAQVNVAIMRAFVRLRRLIASNVELARKLEELDRRVAHHDKHIRALVVAIRSLMSPPRQPSRSPIGFRIKNHR